MDRVTSNLAPFAMVPLDLLGAVSSRAVAVWVALAKHTRADGVCFPAISTIGKLTGYKERAIRDALRELEDAGRLTVTTERGKANLYHLDFTARKTGPDATKKDPGTIPPGSEEQPRHSAAGDPGTLPPGKYKQEVGQADKPPARPQESVSQDEQVDPKPKVDELDEYAVQVALLGPAELETFRRAVAQRGLNVFDDTARALDAYVNQWVAKKQRPDNVVGVLIHLLDKRNRDPITKASVTLKKWVEGKREQAKKVADRAKRDAEDELIAAEAARFLKLKNVDHEAAIVEARGYYKRNGGDTERSGYLQDALTASLDAIRRGPVPTAYLKGSKIAYGLALASWHRVGKFV